MNGFAPPHQLNCYPPRGESMISIRKGKIQDVAKVSSLLLELSEEFIAAEFSETGKQNFLREFTAEKIAEKMSADNFSFDLAEDDGDLIGVVAVRDHTHLFYLFVAKSHQKRGISKILWERARIESLPITFLEFSPSTLQITRLRLTKNLGLC